MLLFVCWVWREKERFGFDSVHVGAKGVVVVVGKVLALKGRGMHTRKSSRKHVQFRDSRGEKH